jgi:hypothetical protein
MRMKPLQRVLLKQNPQLIQNLTSNPLLLLRDRRISQKAPHGPHIQTEGHLAQNPQREGRNHDWSDLAFIPSPLPLAGGPGIP